MFTAVESETVKFCSFAFPGRFLASSAGQHLTCRSSCFHGGLLAHLLNDHPLPSTSFHGCLAPLAPYRASLNIAPAMSAQTLVPRFGNWDVNEDLSYTVVFDKARADKEGKVVGPKDYTGYHKHYSGGGLEDPNSSTLHQEMLNTSNMVNGTRMAHAYHDKRAGMGGRDSQKSSLELQFQNACSSGQTLMGQQASYQSQVDSQFPSGGRSPWGPWMFYSDPARQVAPMLAARGVKSRDGYLHTSAYSSSSTCEANQERLSINSTNSPGRERKFQGNSVAVNLPPPTTARSQRSSASSASSRAGVAPDRSAVPRFGDWDVSDPASAEGFTVIFDNARGERKSKAIHNTSVQLESPARVDEDLYKPNFSHVRTGRYKKAGLWNLVCCSNPNSP